MLTSTELGEVLGLATSTILRMARSGKIPSYMLANGRNEFRFDLDEVKAVLRANAKGE